MSWLRMRILPIASSSKGNAYLVEREGTALLIDCGVSCKRIREGFAALGIGKDAIASSLMGVLITHNHWDHVSGLVTFCRHVDAPLFANAMTAEAVAASAKVDDRLFSCFENGQSFDIGPFSVAPFSIPHDAADPVGYLIRTEDGETYFHGTDIGTPLDSVGLKLAEADIATLESNHDPVMLKASDRAVSLKQRISGPRGHLSNDEAAGLVRRFASPRLRRLFLAHLSQECNSPHLAENTMRATLAEMKRDDIELSVIP